MYVDPVTLPRDIAHPEAFVDFGEFKTACYYVARVLGFRIVEAWKRGEDKASGGFTYDNYHAALLETSRGKVWVLCNAGFPFLAFVAAPLDKCFVDMPQLAKRFVQTTEFRPFSANYLNRAFSKEQNLGLLMLLSEAEMRDVRRWSPNSVGEVIFNEWD